MLYDLINFIKSDEQFPEMAKFIIKLFTTLGAYKLKLKFHHIKYIKHFQQKRTEFNESDNKLHTKLVTGTI